MRSETQLTIRAILSKHIGNAIDEMTDLSDASSIGYWPDDSGAIVDAAFAVILHQSRIDEYHMKEKTNFGTEE